MTSTEGPLDSCKMTQTEAPLDYPCKMTETEASSYIPPYKRTETEDPLDTPCEMTETEAPLDYPCEMTVTEAPLDTPCEMTETEAPSDIPCEMTGTEAPSDIRCEITVTEAPLDTPCEMTETETSLDYPYEMTETEAPLGTLCNCPKWYPVPTCPYHDDLDKLNTIDNTIPSTAHIDPSKTPIVCVLGGPGSGKGTQCEKIIAKYEFTHLSVGDLLRAEVEAGSVRAKFFTNIMEQGGLVPDEIALDLLKRAIMVKKTVESKGILVDGFPRHRLQAIAFEQEIAPPSAIIYFEASEATLTRRLLLRAACSGRTDDNETTIKLRLKTFLENNQQLLDYYLSKICRIDAETPECAIFAQVEKVLDPIVAANQMHNVQSVQSASALCTLA